MEVLIFLLIYLLGCIVAFFVGTYDLYISFGELNSDRIVQTCLFSLLSWPIVFAISIPLFATIFKNMKWSEKIAEKVNRLYENKKSSNQG